MRIKNTCRFTIVFMLLIFGVSNSFVNAQQVQYGGLKGKVLDKSTKEELIGAVVVIKSTTMGAVSDIQGQFTINGIAIGTIEIETKFMGYVPEIQTVLIDAGTYKSIEILMEPESKMLDQVVISGQAIGQKGAISQQINASTILNVISKDRIRELPDQNAAETVGRIAGIYVQRDGGEGQKVVVRGLSPRFSNITINGQRIPSTDANDRSVDLSMVSPSMLSGIEVFKSARPDQDGDAIGGTVNFKFRVADEIPELNVNVQTGYNSQQNEYGQYSANISYGRRFLKDKLGVYSTFNLQRANRSSDQLRGAYLFLGEDRNENSILAPAELDLTDIIEIRKRAGASITTDYVINDKNKIAWDNIYSVTDRDEVRRRRRYRWSEQRQEYEIRDRYNDIGLVTSALRGEHILGKNIELTWMSSFSQSTQTIPNNYITRFRETSAYNSTGIDLTGQKLDSIPKLARNNVDETFLNQLFFDQDKIDDKILTAQIDLKIPFEMGKANGSFKMGGKLRDNRRVRDRNLNVGNYFNPLSRELAFFINDFPTLYQRVPSTGGIAMSNFLSNFFAPDFLNGAYEFSPGALGENLPGLSRNLTTGLVRNLNELNYLSRDFIAEIDDYNATETISAGYAMTEINFSPRLLILAGVRAEYTATTYRGRFMVSGIDYDDGGAFEQITIDSTGGRSYLELLPMLNLRYKISNSIDLRAAATKTISRPDFTNLIPFRRINDNEQTIQQADPNLLHTNAWNYDLMFSYYNKYGLFTIGGFYKRLQNIDYSRVFTRILPPNDPFIGYEISSPDNSTKPTEIYGLEVDLQTNLTFLPKPFDAIVIYANVTLLNSQTFYPFIPPTERETVRPFRPFVVLDAFRAGRAPRQANLISNIAIGYERKGFTSRLSMVYQGDTSSEIGPVAALDSFTLGNTRFDLALKQKIKKGLSVFLNVNNITNTAEISFLGDSSRPTSEAYYGFTADIGVNIKL